MKYIVYCVTVLCSLSNIDGVRGDDLGLGLRGGGHLHLAGLQPLLGTLAVSYLQKLYYTRVFLELYLNTLDKKILPSSSHFHPDPYPQLLWTGSRQH